VEEQEELELEGCSESTGFGLTDSAASDADMGRLLPPVRGIDCEDEDEDEEGRGSCWDSSCCGTIGACVCVCVCVACVSDDDFTDKFAKPDTEIGRFPEVVPPVECWVDSQDVVDDESFLDMVAREAEDDLFASPNDEDDDDDDDDDDEEEDEEEGTAAGADGLLLVSDAVDAGAGAGAVAVVEFLSAAALFTAFTAFPVFTDGLYRLVGVTPADDSQASRLFFILCTLSLRL
jgi:hypothetical protein